MWKYLSLKYLALRFGGFLFRPSDYVKTASPELDRDTLSQLRDRLGTVAVNSPIEINTIIACFWCYLGRLRYHDSDEYPQYVDSPDGPVTEMVKTSDLESPEVELTHSLTKLLKNIQNGVSDKGPETVPPT